MGSVETEVYVEVTDGIGAFEPRQSEVAMSATENGEVSANTSCSSSSSEGARVKVLDSGKLAVSGLVKDKEDDGPRETLHADSMAKVNGFDHCTNSHERPVEPILPMGQVKDKLHVGEFCVPALAEEASSRAVQTTAIRSDGNSHQPFVSCRMTHHRRDSLSGEMPLQGLPQRGEVHVDEAYEYDHGMPCFPVRGRPRHQQQRERHAMSYQDHQGPSQNRDHDLEWQAMEVEADKGTVYAYEETYSFRYVILE